MSHDDFTRATMRMRASQTRFEYIVAGLAWMAARRLNGPHHEITRALASRLEFAKARFDDHCRGAAK